MASQVNLQVSLLLSMITGLEAWRCAKYEHYFSQQPDYIDCVWDCCGNSFNRHCCAPIGIIVGCCIVGAVVVATIIVVLACWWHKRRARYTKGPRLFHNRKHSHYPVAPSSVTRPAPMTGQEQQFKSPGYMPPQAGYGPPSHRGDGPPQDRGYRPPQDREYGPPQDREYGPSQDSDYGPPPGQRLDESYSEKPPMGRAYNERPPVERGYGPPSNRGPPPNRGPPRRDNMSSADEYSDFEDRGQGARNSPRPAPAPTRQVRPAPQEYLDL